MNRRVIIRPEVVEDLGQHATFVAENDLASAHRLFDAFDAAVEHIAEMPYIGAPRLFISRSLTGIRMWPLPGYPNLLLFYRPHVDAVELIRLIHSKQDYHRILGP